MIEQFIISAGIQFFKHVMESYGLQCVNEGGYDPEASCLFYGNYFKEDAERIKAHRGPAMLVWGGSDAIHPSSLEGIRICTDLKHIAISNWLYDKLTRYGFDPKFVPLRTCDATKWKPEPLGNKVYCYCPNETYNRSMVERIAYKSKYEFIIITDHKQNTWEQLYEIYKQSFVGVRLTWWDGSPATVQELGLMGRRTIWNGKALDSIPWTTEASVIESIEKEAEKIGTNPTEFAENCRKELDISKDWLEING